LKGVRFCGKTTTALHHAAGSVLFDESELIRGQAILVSQIILQRATPRLIDEWQLVLQCAPKPSLIYKNC